MSAFSRVRLAYARVAIRRCLSRPFDHNYPQLSPLTKPRLGIYFARAEVCAKETPPMNKVLEVVLTVVALAGLYSAIQTNNSPTANSALRAEQAVVIADGSDPVPLFRTQTCRPTP